MRSLFDFLRSLFRRPLPATRINADDALNAVLGGKKQVSMFERTKLVSKHVK